MEWNSFNNSEGGTSTDHFCKVWLECIQWFRACILKTVERKMTMKTQEALRYNGSRSAQGHHFNNHGSTLVSNDTYQFSKPSINWF